MVPVFILLVMGIVDFANAYNDYNSLRQGVREGARQAVVADWSLEDCTSGSSAQQVACLTTARIGLDPARTRVAVDVDGAYQPGRQLTVCAMYQVRSVTGLFSSIMNSTVLTSRITMRIERIDDVAPLADLSQPPFPGKDWSWC